eukprot:TRINITY_DN43258_c0_g1_i1.p1 TRINITY_DN43258_c0_g1~~TRINITY_DN43258_c0_g1_i1.p1  ORF type:complete len:620 (+),score=101.25 TRINITY_DN43258_c0_g1_i1:60-1862(+)
MDHPLGGRALSGVSCHMFDDDADGVRALLTSLGFTEEQVEAGVAHSSLAGEQDAAGWRKWRDGTHASLLSWEATRHDCTVCYAEPGSFLMNCPVRCSVCSGCLLTFLGGLIREKADSLRCPCGDGAELPYECVSTALRNEAALSEQYLSHVNRSLAVEGEITAECPECGWFCYVLAQDPLKYSVQCRRQSCPLQSAEARGRFCAVCKRPAHLGLTCMQNREKEAIAVVACLRGAQGWQLCPGCGEGCALATGCNRITCVCGTNLCYHCGRELPHEAQHYSHWQDGPYGLRCFGGKKDPKGFTAVGGECPDCLGWSRGRTQCTCKFWRTGGRPPSGEDTEEELELVKVGSRVRVKQWVERPKDGQGTVQRHAAAFQHRGAAGVLTELQGLACTVRLDGGEELRGYVPEMEVLDKEGEPLKFRHAGMWRNMGRHYYCSKVGNEEGPLCNHGGKIIEQSHWSCCGSEEVNSLCSAGCSVRVGDVVRLKPWVRKPEYGWGSMKLGVTGTVRHWYHRSCLIDIGSSRLWRGSLTELEVSPEHTPTRPGAHAGMWRHSYQNCTDPERRSEPICKHRGIVSNSHWSCCGNPQYHSPCAAQQEVAVTL